ncbi:hypothetical protein [Streptomyces sp. IBSNAI001]|uniref:hypothetical protein n=1 Tax=Streptomyces sp. IBSNAI001 TaxID=3457499 RepID=UPI003FD53325
MSTSPGPLLTALDAVWEHTRSLLPEIPPARLAVTPTPPSAKHDSGRLTLEDGVVTGVVISADVLRDGAEAVVETVLHEAAHVLCWVRGLEDTATRGAYHNGNYRDAAEEVGLHWAPTMVRTAARGYATPALSEGSKARYADDIKALSAIIPDVLPHLSVPETPTRHRTPARLTMQCRCTPAPRKLQMSPTVAALGPVVCGVCGKPFAQA